MLQPFSSIETEVDADARKVYQRSQYGKSCSLAKDQFGWKKRELKPNAASHCKRMNINTEKLKLKKWKVRLRSLQTN